MSRARSVGDLMMYHHLRCASEHAPTAWSTHAPCQRWPLRGQQSDMPRRHPPWSDPHGSPLCPCARRPAGGTARPPCACQPSAWRVGLLHLAPSTDTCPRRCRHHRFGRRLASATNTCRARHCSHLPAELEATGACRRRRTGSSFLRTWRCDSRRQRHTTSGEGLFRRRMWGRGISRRLLPGVRRLGGVSFRGATEAGPLRVVPLRPLWIWAASRQLQLSVHGRVCSRPPTACHPPPRSPAPASRRVGCPLPGGRLPDRAGRPPLRLCQTTCRSDEWSEMTERSLSGP
mmetsp:Transcript_10439/g.31440  ORF Transcript_10439/g.31440 Transcript_10439/m.31440 type:complete len:288 (-) Transcript_10439:3493-4356(-)